MGVGRERASSGDEPPIGTSLGRYVLLERVGAGGMGTVFLAHDPELERNVALKLLPLASRGSRLRERQLREAKVMAMVAHPNVASVYDLGVHGGRVFIAMEFVDGWSLKRWLRDERPWREVLEVFLQAGRGLSAAHEKGLVHRDFKPGNVMIGRDGRTRVVDFGLARPVHRSLEEPSAEAPSGESAVGTLAYMAPEQRLGREPDPRSDQFSFCLALWEGLYGERPHRDEDPLPPERISSSGLAADRQVPDVVRQVLERGLAPRAGDRFGSMVELIEALQRSTGEPPPSRRRGREPCLPLRYRVLGPVTGLGRSSYAFDLEAGRMVVVMLAERAEADPPSLVSTRQLFALSHRHLAPVLDVGLDDEGLPFFSLDIATDVTSLFEACQAYPPSRILLALRALLRGLSVLHEQGLAHGCIGRRTAIFAADRVMLAPVALSPPWISLSPERLMGRPASVAADLYAVGALAFERLAGAPPHPGETWEEVTDGVLSRVPPFERLESMPAVAAWVRRLLAERPERRTRSTREALEQLTLILNATPERSADPTVTAPPG